MFQLTRLTVRGFRGFTAEREFVFDEPVVLLIGENHRGKSSTLNAVEWCLFGDECVGKKSGIRERIDWEVVNRFAAEEGAAVEAHFSDDDCSYVVRRETTGNRRRSGGSLTVLLPDGTRLQGEEADRQLAALFRSSFRDFMTTVYQHQETVRAILTDEARQRNDAIDRLLGLSEYKELLRGIREAEIEKAHRGMESAFENLRARAEQSIRTHDNLIREEKARAAAEGVGAEEMTEQEALRRAEELGESLQSLAQDLEVAIFRVPSPQRYEEIAEFREWVKDQTDSMWAHAPAVAKQEALAREQRELATLKGRYEAVRGREMEAREQRDAFVRQNGDQPALTGRTEDLRRKVAALDDKVREINRRANLVREAVEYLRAASGGQSERCPLCDSEVPNLLAHLRKEWEEGIRKGVQELEGERQAHVLQTEGLASLRGQLARLEKELEQAKADLTACLGQVALALKREIGKEDDPGALMSAKLAEIDTELERVGQAIEGKRQRISGSGGIYDQLAKLRTVDDIIKYERKRAIVERIWDTPEFAQLDELRDEAARLVEDVQAIKSSLAVASREEAKDKIEAAGASLSEYFQRMADHPAIPGLVIEVSEDTRSGLNSYAFKSADGTDPMPILSQGDLNCLALSLFLGLARAAGDAQPFAFIMLDDPAQSLGSEAKRRLVGVLETVASWRRLIVSTPDQELKDLLVANVTRSKAVYNFLDWTERDGPNIVRAS